MVALVGRVRYVGIVVVRKRLKDAIPLQVLGDSRKACI
jgi:hypothetical protein